MKRTLLVIAAGLAAGGCATPERPSGLDPRITADIGRVTAERPVPRTARATEDALIPSIRLELPQIDGRSLEPRFDLSVRAAPAQQVFMSIVSGTRYSMLVHPDVSGSISVSLKDVTVREALDALRDLYGYEYRITGTRILVQQVSMQTRVFRVNYMVGQRTGLTSIQVNSGISGQPTGPQAGANPAAASTPGVPMPGGGTPAGAPGGATAGRAGTSTQVVTTTRMDFWSELADSIRAIVGAPVPVTSSASPGGAPGGAPGALPGLPGSSGGSPTGSAPASSSAAAGGGAPEGSRAVVVNPQSGIIVVRAMPRELRGVEEYLRAMRLAVERQVMLEAKIIEVTLGDAYQSGVNWAKFQSNLRAGFAGPRGLDTSSGIPGTPTNTVTRGGGTLFGNLTQFTDSTFSGAPTIGPAGLFGNTAGAFGLALQSGSFTALLEFLESQGSVQVLSSPRIAAINNQKAVLKVGTEEFFLTSIQGGTSGSSSGTTAATTTLPTLVVQPFFSGVALDVLPQIDEDGSVILHVRPTVSDVVTDNKVVNLGSQFGPITLPFAKSTASETDSIVRVQDGNVVAIGGLMKVDVVDTRSGLPGLQDTSLGQLFGTRRRSTVKKELVVLIRPTVVKSETELFDDARESLTRMQNLMNGGPGFVKPISATLP